MQVVSGSDFMSMRPLKFDAKIQQKSDICKFSGRILSKKIQNGAKKKPQDRISGNEQRWDVRIAFGRNGQNYAD